MVTIKDIARYFGVSVGTVSKALNNQKGVSETLREKIKDYAEEQNYTPNLTAINLVKRETNKIALFILSKERNKEESRFSILWVELLKQLLEEVYKINHNLIIYKLFYGDDMKNYIELCKAENVKGAIFFGLMNNDPQIEELKNYKQIPFVIFDNNFGGRLNSVKTDNYIGIKKISEYMKKLEISSKEKIGIITGEDTAQVSLERENAVISEFGKKKIEKFEGNFTKKSGYNGAKYLIETKKINKIICFSDTMAIGAIEYCKEKKYTIPETIKIIGFDNIILSEMIYPKLTTVGHKLDEISKNMIDLIIDKMSGINLLIEPEIYVRESY